MSDADLKRPTKNGQTREQLEKKWHKCLRLSEDKSTTEAERMSAGEKADEIRAKMAEMDGLHGPIDNKLYDDCVQQGKALLKEQDDINWKFGELASQVTTKYGESRLKKFAEDIGRSHSFLRDCRTTVQAWPEKTGRPVFWTAQALNAHPKRLDIIKANPQITQAEAREKMQKYRDRERNRTAAKQPAPHIEEEAEMSLDEQWQNSLASLCGEIIAAPAYWKKEFPKWKRYACPAHIETLVNEATTVFASIAAAVEVTSSKYTEKE